MTKEFNKNLLLDSFLEPHKHSREFKDILVSKSAKIDRLFNENKEIKKILVALLKQTDGVIWVKKANFEAVSPMDTFEVDDGDLNHIKIKLTRG